jgi:hypothetical protein
VADTDTTVDGLRSQLAQAIRERDGARALVDVLTVDTKTSAEGPEGHGGSEDGPGRATPATAAPATPPLDILGRAFGEAADNADPDITSAPDDCAYGPDGHRWSLTFDEESFRLTPIEDCTGECLATVDYAVCASTAPVAQLRLRWRIEHERADGWPCPDDGSCDCGGWWEITPDPAVEAAAPAGDLRAAILRALAVLDEWHHDLTHFMHPPGPGEITELAARLSDAVTEAAEGE